MTLKLFGKLLLFSDFNNFRHLNLGNNGESDLIFDDLTHPQEWPKIFRGGLHPLCGLDSYAPLQRVWFFSCFGQK